jgi:hypothetical protein
MSATGFALHSGRIATGPAIVAAAFHCDNWFCASIDNRQTKLPDTSIAIA